LRECEVRRLRRSGPGGQHRNKVETAVVLRHVATGVEAEANERRSQSENQAVALRRLRLNLALQIRRRADTERSPSTLWRSRLHQRRISVNPAHEDFPSLLAEALDVLSEAGMDVTEAARRLECSTSQLIKFLKLERRAFGWVNRERQRRDLHVLK